ncbi:MAG: GerMN domain-containing protein [Spirochaetales bacterium]|nr:GerMN domain-containing protein [Spirochaetales bacterium]
MAIKRSTIIFSSIFILVLGLSILFYVVFGYPKVERIFFFPMDHTLETSGESRKVPRHALDEENLEEYVREWLLGPLVLEHRNLYPRNTRLLTLIYREGTLYLDFSMNIMMKSDESPLNFNEILDVITLGVKFNFPVVEKVVYTIEGEPLPPLEDIMIQKEKIED